MRKFGVTAAAGILTALLAGQAQAAAPNCAAGIIDLGTGGSATIAQLQTGHCIEAGDKIFGDVVVSGALSGTGSANFSAPATLGSNVTVAFLGTVLAGTSGTIAYDVAIDPAKAGGFLIHDLQKDISLNSDTEGTFASATLTGTAGGLNFSCNRTVNPSGGSCPQTQDFATLLTNLSVTQTITAAANTTVTVITDSISQARPVPEPASLLILASGLLGMGGMAMLRRRRRG
jgi:hypothetical protein